MSEPILSFDGKYAFLSNFYPAQVNFQDWIYPTLEHAFQAAKIPAGRARLQFLHAATPGKAKRLGRAVTLDANWESKKLALMLTLLRDKFSNKQLRAMLLATGDAHLSEGNNHGDVWWGEVNGVGLNWLGHLLMQVRTELQPTLLQRATEAMQEATSMVTRVESSPENMDLIIEARNKVTEACFLASKALSSTFNDATLKARK